VAGVLEGEALGLALEHGEYAVVHRRRALCTLTAGRSADLEIVGADVGARGRLAGPSAVLESELPPGAVDRDDGAGLVEYRHLRAHGVEDRAIELLGGAQGLLCALEADDVPMVVGLAGGGAVGGATTIGHSLSPGRVGRLPGRPSLRCRDSEVVGSLRDSW